MRERESERARVVSLLICDKADMVTERQVNGEVKARRKRGKKGRDGNKTRKKGRSKSETQARKNGLYAIDDYSTPLRKRDEEG